MKTMTPTRFWDYAALGVILLNFTNLYTFGAGLSGISFRVIGMAFILFMLCYCMLNLNVLERIFRARSIPIFLILFYLVPLLTIIYSPYRELRYAAYLINSGLIFLISAIWVYKHGWLAYSKAILFSWGVCILGIVLSYFSPSVFMGVAVLQEAAKGGGAIWSETTIAQADQMRAFGFYMQSNRAAHAVMMHLLILCPFLLHARPYWRLLLLAVSFGCILLTGSRSGFVIFIGLSGLLLYYELRYGVKVKQMLKSGFSALPKYLLLVLAGFIVVFGVSIVVKGGAKSVVADNAVSRIVDSLFSDEYNLFEDVSVQARLLAQRAFIDGILERPLHGWGHAADEVHKFFGRLPLSAHNMFLDLAYQYGLPLAFLMYGLIIKLAFSKEAKRALHYFRFNPALLVVVVLCVYSFVSNTCFDQRMFPSMFGFLFVVLYFPREVSKLDSPVKR